jgi:4-hydroxybenzoate polyprenyltransferase
MWKYRKIHLRRAPSKASKIAKNLLWAALIIFLIATGSCVVNLYQVSQLPGAEQVALVSRKPSPKDALVFLLYALSLGVAIAAFLAKAVLEGRDDQLNRLSDKKTTKRNL